MLLWCLQLVSVSIKREENRRMPFIIVPNAILYTSYKTSLCYHPVLSPPPVPAVSSVRLVPEVSQEGLLQPYSTYADVTLFHFHIPHEVTRVTWEFAAFMDDPGCPVREVHMWVACLSFFINILSMYSIISNLDYISKGLSQACKPVFYHVIGYMIFSNIVSLFFDWETKL